MKRVLAGVILLAFSSTIVLEALGSRKAKYIGGTITGIKANAEGTLTTTDLEALLFTLDKGKLAPIRIVYSTITALEYGQHASRRVVAAVLISPWILFSKKRRHYLTIEYKDAADVGQAIVLELGKNLVRSTIATCEVRSGIPVTYQDEEARKAAKGGV
jgi:hypothetical protein